MTEGLKVTRIKDGTVLDHLPAGSALDILDILHVDSKHPIIIAMNVGSSKQGTKDIIKIEKKLLSKKETDEIGLFAPHVTINIIKNQKVHGKRHVKMPDELSGLLVCPNKKCITNKEVCETKFVRNGSKYKCYFCERHFPIEDFKMS